MLRRQWDGVFISPKYTSVYGSGLAFEPLCASSSDIKIYSCGYTRSDISYVCIGRLPLVNKQPRPMVPKWNVLPSIREEHFYTRFAPMYYELPREKAGEAGWAARRSFSCAFSGLLRGLKRGGSSAP
eukprot:scaffold946_cov359-Pavlova_lutheri.AAC.5